MIQKHYLKDRADFDNLSRDWPVWTPEPPYYPCIVVWTWYYGARDWVGVEYVFEDDFTRLEKSGGEK